MLARKEPDTEIYDWFVRHQGRPPESVTELLLAAEQELWRLNPRLQGRRDAFVQAATSLGGVALEYARRRWATYWLDGLGVRPDQACGDLGLTQEQGRELAGQVMAAAHEILVRSEGYRLQGRGAPLREIDLTA